MLAVDAKTGHILWAKHLAGHNTHDWDGGFGSSLATLGTKTVIVHGTKRGDAFALYAANGGLFAIRPNTEVQAKPDGTGPICRVLEEV